MQLASTIQRNTTVHVYTHIDAYSDINLHVLKSTAVSLRLSLNFMIISCTIFFEVGPVLT